MNILVKDDQGLGFVDDMAVIDYALVSIEKPSHPIE